MEPGRAKGAPGEAVADWDEAVDLKSAKFHRDATILVPNENGHEPMKVGVVLNSGSRVTCIISDNVTARLVLILWEGRLGFPLGGILLSL